MPQREVIVIGAGIAGTSVAASLAKHYSVVVLEQESQPGYHATGRSAATWAPFYGPPVIQALTALSGPTLNTPPADFSDQQFTSPRGQMILGTTESDAAPEESTREMVQLSKAEAKAKVSLLKTELVESIWYTEGLVNIDVDLLHQAYIRQLKDNNASVACNSRVIAITRKGRNWVVSTGNETFSAPIIVNAAGAWADSIAALAGISPLGLQPKRRTAALVPYKIPAMNSWPLLFNAVEDFYCIPFGGSLLISPADESPVEPHDAWPDDIDVAVGIDRFQKLIDYEITKIDHSWAGLRTFATDGAPVVGFDNNTEGFFWLAGQGGYGIQTSAAMATLASGLIKQEFESDQEQYQHIANELTPCRFDTT